MDLKKYVDRRKFSVFVMVSEFLERAEERRDIIISSWRDLRFEEDHGFGVFLIERNLVRGCVCQVLCMKR